MALNHDLVRRVFGDTAASYRFEGAPIEAEPELKMDIRNLNVSYGSGLRGKVQQLFSGLNKDNPDLHTGHKRFHAIKDVSLPVYKNEVLALVGPSGCGKSTFLRALNRMNDTIEGCITTGQIMLDGKDIHDRDVDVELLRKQVGIVWQKPNPFARSVFNNVAYGVRIHGLAHSKADVETAVEKSLQKTGLWDEVKDRLDTQGHALSGGQQQRLCIARTAAVKPDVILMDEPCSALDPVATQKIEDHIRELQKDYTVIMITHNLQQAARIAQRVAHFHMGELVSYGPTEDVFKNTGHVPVADVTQKYIGGAMG